jgi:FAD binding domain
VGSLNSDFDAIVVGAGLAGLCCAGELVLHGKRPLLVCETREVGAVFAVKRFSDGSTAFLQHITWQLGWGGGWWYNLARSLNVPVRLYPGLEFEVKLKGSDTTIPTPVCVSAAALSDVLASAFPAVDRGDLDRVLGAALSIPPETLLKMQDVALSDWLGEQDADAMTTNLVLALSGVCNDLTIDQSRGLLSVFGGIGIFRLLLCGEGTLPIVYPTIRDGLCIPLAQAIERRGGGVWRGRKLAGVIIDEGRATGVRFEDGTEVTAPHVAIATGNPRIPALLDPLPPEIQAPLEYSAGCDLQDFNVFYLLRRRLVENDRMVTSVFDPTTFSVLQHDLCISGLAPWTTQPGKQIMVTHFAVPPEEVTAAGGEEAIYARMQERSDQAIPGLLDAAEEILTQSHRHHWLEPVSVGPKLPRCSSSVDGLWFVGDGSTPCAGIWTEAAASCGVLGAREIVQSLVDPG